MRISGLLAMLSDRSGEGRRDDVNCSIGATTRGEWCNSTGQGRVEG